MFCVTKLHNTLKNLSIKIFTSQRTYPTASHFYNGLKQKKRSALAESITLVESVNIQKKILAQQLLSKILNDGNQRVQKTFRIGLSGPPGAGKSTFIEALGQYLTEKENKVAVLAVDPSSSRTGGSLLGDKTRMPHLSRNPNAYIRPSPNSGTLGGVARCTNEAMLLCEFAGFNIVIVETVGVGQSEIAVSNMVDMFVLLINPSAGDELQGIKKGIVEVADMIIVNKADGALLPAARRIQAEYISALKFIRPKNKQWKTKVKRISSLNKEDFPDIWAEMEKFKELMYSSGELDILRRSQYKKWMWSYVNDKLMQILHENENVKSKITDIEKQVELGVVTSGQAADILIKEFKKS